MIHVGVILHPKRMHKTTSNRARVGPNQTELEDCLHVAVSNGLQPRMALGALDLEAELAELLEGLDRTLLLLSGSGLVDDGLVIVKR